LADLVLGEQNAKHAAAARDECTRPIAWRSLVSVYVSSDGVPYHADRRVPVRTTERRRDCTFFVTFFYCLLLVRTNYVYSYAASLHQSPS
jgi:hypothetical protein